MQILCFIFLFLIFPLPSSTTISYLTLPFTITQNQTHIAHNIKVQINQCIYMIDVNLQGNKDYLLKHQDMVQIKGKSRNWDYSKKSDSVYGVVDLQKTFKVDHRLPLHRQMYLNLWYYLQHLLPEPTWTNFKQTQKIPIADRPSILTQGTINLAAPKWSPFLNSLKLYHPLFKSTIVSFRMNQNNANGYVYFGVFPVDQLKKENAFGYVKIENDHQKSWKITANSIELKRYQYQGSKSLDVSLFTLPAKFKLSLSSKGLRLPRDACLALLKQLQGCQMQEHPSSSFKILSCSSAYNNHKWQSYKISLKTGIATPIQINIQNLLRTGDHIDGKLWFEVYEGIMDDFQIGSVILQQYLIGLDYSKGVFYYGHKRDDSWFNRYFFLKLILALNIIIFVLSVLVLQVVAKMQPSPQSVPKQAENNEQDTKLSSNMPKTSGYQMASMTQQDTIRD